MSKMCHNFKDLEVPEHIEEEINNILLDMGHTNAAVREDAYYKWIKFAERYPNIFTDEKKEKLLKALIHYE
ncbi:MAG: hypothetical protein ACTSQE_03320 [Candidatus Heimdallarchaeaceae archaeon]